jgi:hypothetical protein
MAKSNRTTIVTELNENRRVAYRCGARDCILRSFASQTVGKGRVCVRQVCGRGRDRRCLMALVFDGSRAEQLKHNAATVVRLRRVGWMCMM